MSSWPQSYVILQLQGGCRNHPQVSEKGTMTPLKKIGRDVYSEQTRTTEFLIGLEVCTRKKFLSSIMRCCTFERFRRSGSNRNNRDYPTRDFAHQRIQNGEFKGIFQNKSIEQNKNDDILHTFIQILFVGVLKSSWYKNPNNF